MVIDEVACFLQRDNAWSRVELYCKCSCQFLGYVFNVLNAPSKETLDGIYFTQIICQNWSTFVVELNDAICSSIFSGQSKERNILNVFNTKIEFSRRRLFKNSKVRRSFSQFYSDGSIS